MKIKVTSKSTLKFPKCGIFNVLQLPNTMIFSASKHQLRDSSMMNNIDTKQKSEYKAVMIKRQNTPLQEIVEMDGTFMYSCLDDSHLSGGQQLNARKIIIANQLSRSNREIIQSQLKHQVSNYSIRSIADTDYFIPTDGLHSVVGNYGENTFRVISKDFDNLFQPKSTCSTSNKYISSAKKVNESMLAFSYNGCDSSNEDFNTPGTAEGVCCYDLLIQSVSWNYWKRQQLFTFPVPISNFCLAIGHYFMNGNQFDLALHDVRQNTIASILDTSRDDFGGAADFPHFNMLYKLSNWELATVWGPPACSTSKIVKLDIRFPIRKQILINYIPYPKFLYKSRLKNNQFWTIRNQYKSYKYVNTIIESLQFD